MEHGCKMICEVTKAVRHRSGTRIQAFYLLVQCSFLQAKESGTLGTPLQNWCCHVQEEHVEGETSAL